MAAAAPRTTLLFADSFRHERLCQHVDEVNVWSRHFSSSCCFVMLGSNFALVSRRQLFAQEV
jgi:hypothetical protein